ncbi:hypothetical protein [Photobacterium lutimaris]|uniref:Uncharacterized protein n=1 Tax=Photobacterium lutimaris TaxID=388278 RepID=A0A2T3J2M0_9GAMM|nr:hypothetical protein [Photobacterium lutimaris]PSU35547.1 hypothetical protein C9I99_00565 [Photobacterium lutimaris]TDR78598.1 hypothetical protein DFP78_101109 [Photobacterium lutimaris]
MSNVKKILGVKTNKDKKYAERLETEFNILIAYVNGFHNGYVKKWKDGKPVQFSMIRDEGFHDFADKVEYDYASLYESLSIYYDSAISAYENKRSAEQVRIYSNKVHDVIKSMTRLESYAWSIANR